VSPPRLPNRFSVFEADPQTGELRKNGVRLRIQDQPFQILLRLLERPGQIVTREELKAALWSTDTFVDFDNGLNMAVKRLREALGDDADRPIFIETLPRRGYRFIAPMERPASQTPSPSAPKRRFERLRPRWNLIGVGAALFSLLLGIGIWRFSRIPTETPLPAIEVVPLAGLSGFEVQPAFSPHGKHVAFVLYAAENSGIYTTMVGSERALHLTSNFGDCCPRWSPDGGEIAFSRLSDVGLDIYEIPAFGGRERRLSSWPPEGHQISTVPPWRLMVGLWIGRPMAKF
jgi:DNA-binding winged helix-turn-helix (wHTH) protein